MTDYGIGSAPSDRGHVPRVPLIPSERHPQHTLGPRPQAVLPATLLTVSYFSSESLFPYTIRRTWVHLFLKGLIIQH